MRGTLFVRGRALLCDGVLFAAGCDVALNSGFSEAKAHSCDNVVAVEKVPFRQKQSKVRGYKMPWNPRGSFISHPDAILFLRFWRERVFQQPRLLAQPRGAFANNQ